MATVLLVRHAETGEIGRRLSGRTPGVHLSNEGLRQSERLGERLSGRDIAGVYTSPLERARETAAPIAARFGLEPIVRPPLNEMDFGSWNGMGFEELDALEAWKRFNVNRTGVRPPHGEHVIDVQARMVAEIDALREHHPSQTVVVVGHADPLKTVLAHYLGFSLELMSRIELSPASTTELYLDAWTTQLRSLNVTA
jgi:probable phosphoglycerate mutase